VQARVTTIKLNPDSAQQEAASAFFQEKIVPAAREQAGFAGMYLLSAAGQGKGLIVSLWDTAGDLEASYASGFLTKQLKQFDEFLGAPPTVALYDVTAQG
jgi:heme-degrading monooxygenase HmoA